jgi:hypothetical protein
MNVTVAVPDQVWWKVADRAERESRRVPDFIAEVLADLSEGLEPMAPSDVEMARFLAGCGAYQTPKRLKLPNAEIHRRAYERETERLRRFIAGRV